MWNQLWTSAFISTVNFQEFWSMFNTCTILQLFYYQILEACNQVMGNALLLKFLNGYNFKRNVLRENTDIVIDSWNVFNCYQCPGSLALVILLYTQKKRIIWINNYFVPAFQRLIVLVIQLRMKRLGYFSVWLGHFSHSTWSHITCMTYWKFLPALSLLRL